MKMKFPLFIMFSISISIGFTQPLILEWQNCFGGNGDDQANDIVLTEDGYIIAGWDPTKLLLLKTNLDGSYIWEKTYGGIEGGEGAYRIFSAELKNFYVFGTAYSSGGDISNDPYPEANNFWILKIDSAGNIIWDRIYGGNCIDKGGSATPTSDGGVIAFGHTCSNDGDITNFYGTWDTWMIKIDNEGNKVWDFTMGTEDFDFSSAIIKTSDHGFLVSSSSTPTTGGNIECIPTNENSEIILFKLDSLANIEWQQCYGGSSHESIFDMAETSLGYLLVCGSSSGDGDLAGSGYHIGYNNFGYATGDIWLVKTDFTGNIFWSKCFGGSQNDYPRRVFSTEDGGFIVFGETGSFDGDVTGNHSSGPGISDIWVIKINQAGDLIWQQCIGGNGYDRLVSGVVDNGDGSYVIASTIYDFNSGQVECPTTNGSDQVWLIKVMDTTVVSVHEKPLAGNSVKAYPNPANDFVIFEEVGTRPVVSLPGNPQTISVTDIYGRAVAHLSVTGDITVWDVRGVAPGVYIYRIGNSSSAYSGKEVIVR